MSPHPFIPGKGRSCGAWHVESRGDGPAESPRPPREGSEPPRDGDESPKLRAEPPQHDGEGDGHAPPTGERIAPFSPRQLRWQVLADGMLHWTAVLLLLLALWAIIGLAHDQPVLYVLPVVVLLLAWVLVNRVSAGVAHELPRLSAMIVAEPAQGERWLAAAMRRRPLLRWVRLMLYHRLAILRHRQRRYAEAGAICRAVLGYRLGPAEHARPSLLLLLTEAALERRDLMLAFASLRELHHTRLGLTEALQRLALQTRYELAAGLEAMATEGSERKLRLAELMPAAQCGAMHAMLATAAQRTRRDALARSLWARAELLASPRQLEQFRAGQFSLDVINAHRQAAEAGQDLNPAVR